MTRSDTQHVKVTGQTMDTTLNVTTSEVRLITTALEFYRSHLLGYVHPHAVENQDEYGAQCALIIDERVEQLLKHIESVGLIFNDGEN